MKRDLVIGVSCFFHDSAIAIVENGIPIFCLQEERISRKKGDKRFPELALKAAISYLSIKPQEVQACIYYENPFKKLERIKSFCPSTLSITKAERLRRIPSVLVECINAIFGSQVISNVLIGDHHLSHACSALMVAPFYASNAHILCIDAVGEWDTSTYWQFSKPKGIELLSSSSYPDSLGLFYSAMTNYLGFKINSGEYKVMGLAPYGKPIYKEIILDKILHVSTSFCGRTSFPFRLNPQFIAPHIDGHPFTSALTQLFGPARLAEQSLLTRHFDMASSVQAVLDFALETVFDTVVDSSFSKNVCMAGGVSLNCSSNGYLRRKFPEFNIFTQPASGDSGGALGAALSLPFVDAGFISESYEHDSKTNLKPIFSPFLGVGYSVQDIAWCLDSTEYRDFISVQRISDENDYCKLVAQMIASGQVIGWFHGRQEFGPRSLGARSIIASPLVVDMQSRLNLKVKFRESFRPFAPSVLAEYFTDYFIGNSDEYMLTTSLLRRDFFCKGFMDSAYTNMSAEEKLRFKRSSFNPVTHVDGSARCQIVDKQLTPLYWKLINAFAAITGVGMVINTSFNVRGEPIVMSPLDALKCFLSTDIDVLAIGDRIVTKTSSWSLDIFEHFNDYPLD